MKLAHRDSNNSEVRRYNESPTYRQLDEKEFSALLKDDHIYIQQLLPNCTKGKKEQILYENYFRPRYVWWQIRIL